MKVLIKRVNEEPEVKDIKIDLDALHEIVGGYIEAIYFDYDLDSQGIFAYANEEAKLKHLDCNFWLYDKQDVCCGDVIFLKDNGTGGEISLTDEDIELIKKFLEKSKMTEREKEFANEVVRRTF